MVGKNVVYVGRENGGTVLKNWKNILWGASFLRGPFIWKHPYVLLYININNEIKEKTDEGCLPYGTTPR